MNIIYIYKSFLHRLHVYIYIYMYKIPLLQSLTRSLPQRETQQDNLCPTGKRTAALFLCWLLSPPWAAVSRDMFGHIHHLCLHPP